MNTKCCSTNDSANSGRGFGNTKRREGGSGRFADVSTSSAHSSKEFKSQWNSRSKRLNRKTMTLQYLIKGVCESKETCIDWLKNMGFIPKVMFCPNCRKKMKFEPHEHWQDGYFWVCREKRCEEDPPFFSVRHGTWFEKLSASFVELLLFTYLWCYGFSVMNILQELNMTLESHEQWYIQFVEICEMMCGDIPVEERIIYGEVTQYTGAGTHPVNIVCNRIKKSKDPFMEFLKEADSIN